MSSNEKDPFNNLPLLGEVKVVTKIKPHQPRKKIAVKVPVLIFDQKVEKENLG